MLYNRLRFRVTLCKCHENGAEIMKRILPDFSVNNFTLFLIIISILAATACAPRTPVPSIRIISPIDGATIPAGDVTITALVSNFDLVNKIGPPNVPAEGRIVYFFDVMPPTDPRFPAFPSKGYDYYYPTIANTHTWSDVEPGSHVFWVELVKSDLTPLYPPIVAGVTVTVVPTKTPSP